MAPMTLRLIIINTIMWLSQIVLNRALGVDITNLLGLHYFQAEVFGLWQPITHMFLHSTSSISHLAFNMFALWIFGSVIEQHWGSLRLLYFYILCGITGAISQQLVWYIEFRELMGYQMVEVMDSWTVPVRQYLNIPLGIGASGAVFGLLLAFGMLFPNRLLFFFPLPFPIKAKYIVAIYGITELYMGLHPSPGSSVGHFAHIGGMVGGFILIRLWRKHGRIDKQTYD